MNDQRNEAVVEVLRYALGGATDAATRGVDRRIREGDTNLEREVDALRLTAEVVRADARAGPSDAAMERLASLVRAHDPLPPPEEWFHAVPLGAALGVRGAVRKDGVLQCETPEFKLLVKLVSSAVDDGHGATGHIVDHMGAPVEGVDVSWIVDGEEQERACTDDLGEFSFTSVAGRELMLRVQGSHGPRYIQLAREEST